MAFIPPSNRPGAPRAFRYFAAGAAVSADTLVVLEELARGGGYRDSAVPAENAGTARRDD